VCPRLRASGFELRACAQLPFYGFRSPTLTFDLERPEKLLFMGVSPLLYAPKCANLTTLIENAESVALY
jgi:hypothetical protein